LYIDLGDVHLCMKGSNISWTQGPIFRLCLGLLAM
jgi:hypothetical protein